MKQALGNRVLPEFSYAVIFSVCFALVLTGCNNSSAPPPDTMPPTAPGNLTVTAISSTQINLSWSASTDNVGVTGYKVERCSGAGCSNFAQIATSTTAAYSDTGLTPSTSYSYRVRATDAAGNLSTYSNSGTVGTPAPPIQVSLSLNSASVQAGIGWQKFAAIVLNDSQNNGVSWTLTQSGANCVPGCGTLSANSSLSGIAITYTAPFNQPNPSNVTLTATSVTDTTKSMPAAITVTPAVSVSVSPTPVPVQFNAIQFFTATVQNDAANAGVTWTLSGNGCSGATCGTLSAASSASGAPIRYTGPSSVPANPAVTLTATSVTDAARSAPATITVTVNPGTTAVTVSPQRAAITKWQTQTFTPTVTGASDMTVTWQVDGVAGGNSASLGTIDATGKYSPPTSGTIGGSHTITAVSNADVTKSAASSVGVTDLAGVTTYHNDFSRDGSNSQEFALTTANVKTATFGKLFSCQVDGEVFAQPLWVANLAIGGGPHNVIFVATQNDSVYAFDADAKPCQQYWQKSFLSAGVTAVPFADTGTDDINKKIGITGTPVIDTASNTLYVVAKTKEGSTNYHQRLHALSLIDGSEKFGGPMDITSAITVSGSGDTGDSSVGCTSTPGNVPFCPLREGQRPGLALVNGIVYVSWASHGDNQPYHGWIMGFNATTLALVSKFNDSPDGREGGIWMAGGAPAVDANNNLYVITGNGDFNASSATAPNRDYGDSFLRLTSSLTVADYFSPSNQGSLDAADLDLGSGGAVILVDLPASAPHPHLLVGGGKGSTFNGEVFVLDRTNLGKFNANSNNIVQTFALGGAIFSTAAFWQNRLYMAGVGQSLAAFTLSATTSQFTPVAAQSAATFGFPGATPSVSSSGTTNGIVWVLDTNATSAPNASGVDGPAVLHAYDALNLATELFHSDSTIGATNAAGNAVKFCVPTVANGKVYVGTQTELTVFGLLP